MQGLFRYVQAYSKPCVTLAYLQPWYIQNPDIFRTTSIFRTLAYSQAWHIRFAKIVNGYNYFRSLLRSLLHEINIMR